MIADDITRVLPDLRAQAESLMLDAGTASRPTGGYVYDPETQSEVEATEPLFASPCKIQSRTLVVRDEEVGGRTATVVRLELHLPADTAPLTTGDLFTVDTPHASSTVPAGRAFRVLAPHEKSLPTARRYDVEVYTA